MKSGPGNQRQTGAGRGGTPGLRICMLLFLNPTLIAVNSCRCGINGSVSSGLLEPPYTEPYVRWCGRTAEVTPPPTRFAKLNMDLPPRIMDFAKAIRDEGGRALLVGGCVRDELMGRQPKDWDIEV